MRKVDVVVLTAITLEYKAVRQVGAGAVEANWEEQKGPNGLPVVFRSFHRGKGRPLRVALAQAGDMGAVAATNTLLCCAPQDSSSTLEPELAPVALQRLPQELREGTGDLAALLGIRPRLMPAVDERIATALLAAYIHHHVIAILDIAERVH